MRHAVLEQYSKRRELIPCPPPYCSSYVRKRTAPTSITDVHAHYCDTRPHLIEQRVRAGLLGTSVVVGSHPTLEELRDFRSALGGGHGRDNERRASLRHVSEANNLKGGSRDVQRAVAILRRPMPYEQSVGNFRLPHGRGESKQSKWQQRQGGDIVLGSSANVTGVALPIKRQGGAKL